MWGDIRICEEVGGWWGDRSRHSHEAGMPEEVGSRGKALGAVHGGWTGGGPQLRLHGGFFAV